ncbi:hypothetical protein [Brachyspira pilosicoli]|uniref:Uncharacterized protein n=1 Tax=Brachyspira pilosicoli (strain ATCC BAA-1826 / 95/1000) TaxID=759914 RepID=D8IEA3_BRAP9|nr:hypothetical protein [Brachyspira pilosicoli]ADK31476.1 hypothetical protein BP951000_1493 [Brachyspira pilosicoli 95/1000]
MPKGILINNCLINIAHIAIIHFQEEKQKIVIITVDSGVLTAITFKTKEEYNKYYKLLRSLFKLIIEREND